MEKEDGAKKEKECGREETSKLEHGGPRGAEAGSSSIFGMSSQPSGELGPALPTAW